MSAEISLGWNNGKLRAGARQAESIAQNTANRMKASMGGLRKVSPFVVMGGGGYALERGMSSIVERGFKFNAIMKDGELAIAKLLQKFDGLNETEARTGAAAAIQKLIDLEPRTAGTLDTLVRGFQAALGPGRDLGLTVEQIIELTSRMANTIGNMNLPLDQLNQEIRSLLSGNIGADSAVAKNLGITSADISNIRKAGRAYEFLSDKIGELGVAGDSSQVARSTLNSAINKAAGALTKGLFEDAIAEGKGLAQVLTENASLFEDMGAELSSLIESTVVFFRGSADVISAGFAAAVMDMEDSTGRALTLAERWEAALDSIAADRFERDLGGSAPPIPQGSASATGTPSGADAAPATGAEINDQLRTRQQLQDKTLALAEAEFDQLLDRLPVELRLKAVRERIAQLEAQANQPGVGPQDELDRLDTQKQILDWKTKERELIRDIADETARARQQAQDEAAAAQELANQRQQSTRSLAAELAILEARAAGREKEAQALERTVQIQEDARRIQAELNTSAEEALGLAKRKADLEDQIAKRSEQASREERVRSKIQGYSGTRQGGIDEASQRARDRAEAGKAKREAAYARSFQGLAGFEKMQASEFGSSTLTGPSKFEGLDYFGGRGVPVKMPTTGTTNGTAPPLMEKSLLPEDKGAPTLEKIAAEMKGLREDVRSLGGDA